MAKLMVSPQIKPYFFTKKEVHRRDCFEWKSIGEKQEFRVKVVSPWLNCRVVSFL